jgi:hypothetical protein
VSLTHRRTQGALLFTTLLAISCAADPGEAPKPAFGTSEDIVGGDDAATDDRGAVEIDSPDTPDGSEVSPCPATAPTLCGSECVDTTTSVDNCGACQAMCLGGATCVGSHCTSTDGAVSTQADSGDEAPTPPADGSVSVDARVPADSGAEATTPADATATDAQPCPQCTGCCDTGGNCSKGTSATACGVDGVFCVDCTATSLTCHTGGICR